MIYQTVPFSPKPWPGEGERTAPSADVSCGTPGCWEDTGEPCGAGADGARQETRGLPGAAAAAPQGPSPPDQACPWLCAARRLTNPADPAMPARRGFLQGAAVTI